MAEHQASADKTAASGAPILDARLRILATIGSGATSTVYRAYDSALEREVAVKKLRIADRPERQLARLKREVKALSGLHDPHIVQVYYLNVAPDREPFIVMELVTGQSLAERLKEGKLSPQEAVDLLVQLCDGLSRLHESGFVHRDLKPGNIVVSDTGTVKIIDLGLARALVDDVDQKLTGDGSILGTPLYMSPEQVEGRPCTVQSDIYSLACIGFEMLSGEPPFSGDTAAEVMLKHLKQTIPLLPSFMEASLRKAMSKDPSGRQASVDEFKKEILSLAVPKSTTLAKKTAGIGGKKSLAVAGIVVVGAFAIVFCSVGKMNSQKPELASSELSATETLHYSEKINDLARSSTSTEGELRKYLDPYLKATEGSDSHEKALAMYVEWLLRKQRVADAEKVVSEMKENSPICRDQILQSKLLVANYYRDFGNRELALEKYDAIAREKTTSAIQCLNLLDCYTSIAQLRPAAKFEMWTKAYAESRKIEKDTNSGRYCGVVASYLICAIDDKKPAVAAKLAPECLSLLQTIGAKNANLGAANGLLYALGVYGGSYRTHADAAYGQYLRDSGLESFLEADLSKRPELNQVSASEYQVPLTWMLEQSMVDSKKPPAMLLFKNVCYSAEYVQDRFLRGRFLALRDKWSSMLQKRGERDAIIESLNLAYPVLLRYLTTRIDLMDDRSAMVLLAAALEYRTYQMTDKGNALLGGLAACKHLSPMSRYDIDYWIADFRLNGSTKKDASKAAAHLSKTYKKSWGTKKGQEL